MLNEISLCGVHFVVSIMHNVHSLVIVYWSERVNEFSLEIGNDMWLEWYGKAIWSKQYKKCMEDDFDVFYI